MNLYSGALGLNGLNGAVLTGGGGALSMFGYNWWLQGLDHAHPYHHHHHHSHHHHSPHHGLPLPCDGLPLIDGLPLPDGLHGLPDGLLPQVNFISNRSTVVSSCNLYTCRCLTLYDVCIVQPAMFYTV